MKCSIRCLSVLVCLVLSLAAFSVTVNAEEIDIKPYNFYVTSGGLGAKDIIGMLYPNDGTLQKHYTEASIQIGSKWYVQFSYYLGYNDNSFIIPSGTTANITIENINATVWISNDYYDYEITVPEYVTGYLLYSDGSTTPLDFEVVNKTDRYDIKFSATANKDVEKIVFVPWYAVTKPYGQYFDIYIDMGEIRDKDTDHSLRIDVQDPNTGLLSGIWGSLTEGFQSLGNKITDLWNSIKELPTKLWELIENGLKNLFVPDEQYMIDYKSRWEDELSEKLGAVWQVTDILLSSWERITVADEQDTIEMPEVVIPLPEGNQFSFGGYDVKIVPEGFEFLADACKMALGILCTWLFIGGLRKRYDEVMGVEQ